MFSDDAGGFRFGCDDCKISLDASTWATRLSQINKSPGKIWILTHDIIDADYVSRIIQKRPEEIYIIAHSSAHIAAKALKTKFSNIRVALNENINAKAVLIEPGTIWISSADFGSTKCIESTIGIHSPEAYKKYLELYVLKVWAKSNEIM